MAERAKPSREAVKKARARINRETAIKATQPPRPGGRVSFETAPGHGPMHLWQGWVTGGDDEVEFELGCGAGLGSPIMHLRVTNKATGAEVQEHVNITDGLTAWVTRLAETLG